MLTIPNSINGTYKEELPGTTLPISCKKGFTLNGSDHVTCQDTLRWTEPIPKCEAPSGWTAVKREVNLPWDLETTPLQIKTDSTAGSGERIIVAVFNKDNNWLSNVGVTFSSSMQYWINVCGAVKHLPVKPPVEVDKIWTVIKTDTAIIITCNGVEVLNYLFADSSNSDCITKLGNDVVEKIAFHSDDTASEFYKAGKGLDLNHTTSGTAPLLGLIVHHTRSFNYNELQRVPVSFPIT